MASVLDAHSIHTHNVAKDLLTVPGRKFANLGHATQKSSGMNMRSSYPVVLTCRMYQSEADHWSRCVLADLPPDVGAMLPCSPKEAYTAKKPIQVARLV